jgi:hypothetical protein
VPEANNALTTNLVRMMFKDVRPEDEVWVLVKLNPKEATQRFLPRMKTLLIMCLVEQPDMNGKVNPHDKSCQLKYADLAIKRKREQLLLESSSKN